MDGRVRAEVRFGPGGTADLTLIPESNLVTGGAELTRQLRGPLTTLEEDLLRVASAVYATDLAVVRPSLENVCRSIDLEVPVINHAAFSAVRSELEYALYLLSRDSWALTFVPHEGTPEAHRVWPQAEGTTLLFSGGLDSLTAAVELLEANEPLSLVSHYTRNPTTVRSQAQLLAYLEGRFGPVASVRVRSSAQNSALASFPGATRREPSQRTRSFLFVAIAAIAARRSGRRNIVMMAENGPIAIHLALSTARIGPFSTHTAHPEYLRVISQAISSLLSCALPISNPYLYETKAEVVRRLVGRHDDAIATAVSCWQASRIAVGHCGFCIPCLVRRIALESNGYHADVYARDILDEDLDATEPDDDGLRNLADLVEFSSHWASTPNNAQLAEDYLELSNGDVDLSRAIDMYRRFAAETLTIARHYPQVVRRFLA